MGLRIHLEALFYLWPEIATIVIGRRAQIQEAEKVPMCASASSLKWNSFQMKKEKPLVESTD